MYFQIVYNALREPMRRALEALIMQRQTEGKATFPAFAQQLIDRGKREGERARIQECMDAATLDRWSENVLGAKSVTDVLS